LSKRKTEAQAPIQKPKSRITAGWGLLILLLVSLALYLRTLGYSFVYDDTTQIAQNPTIRSWSYLPHYFTQQIWGYSNVWTNLYRPVFLISLRICDELFGLNPVGWHAFAVLIHLLDICLVYQVVRKLLGDTDDDKWSALTAAAIFAVHPIQLETVAWISGMTDAVMAAPLLLGFWCYLHWRQNQLTRWLVLCMVSFGLALLTKESGIALLLLIFVYELTMGRAAAVPQEKARVSVAFALLSMMTLGYFIVRWMVLHTPIGRPAADISLSAAILTIPGVVLRYLRMLVAPYDMSAFFPSEYVTSVSFTHFVLPLLALILILVSLDYWARRTKTPAIAFAALWIFVAMLPVLDLRMMQPDDFIHIRFLYVSSIGFSLLTAVAIRQLLGEPKLRAAAAVAIVSLFVAGSYAQMDYWRDNDSLYRRGIAIAPNNPVPKTNLAAEYLRSGHDDEAITLLDDVLRHHPNFWTANYDRGSIAYKRQDWPATAEYMDRAIKNHGLEVDAYVYRGFALMKLGRLPEAEQSVRQAIALRPSARIYHFVLGLVLRQERRWQDALSAFENELKINPHDNTSAIHVADLKRRLGQTSAAAQ
jgi:hypothetical protein